MQTNGSSDVRIVACHSEPRVGHVGGLLPLTSTTTAAALFRRERQPLSHRSTSFLCSVHSLHSNNMKKYNIGTKPTYRTKFVEVSFLSHQLLARVQMLLCPLHFETCLFPRGMCQTKTGTTTDISVNGNHVCITNGTKRYSATLGTLQDSTDWKSCEQLHKNIQKTQQ